MANSEEELFEFVFETRLGKIGLLAELQFEEKQVHLKNIVIHPIGAAHIPLGTREVLHCRLTLAKHFGSLGYEKVRVTGERLTGGNVGKKVDFLFRTS